MNTLETQNITNTDSVSETCVCVFGLCQGTASNMMCKIPISRMETHPAYCMFA